MIEIVEQPIEIHTIVQSAASDHSGATVLFLGTTRQFTAGKETARLEYECYREMAIRKMTELRDGAISTWRLNECSVVHRVGVVPVGEASVAIAVSSAHRKAAFEAAEWLIDQLKTEVPIWKQECYADGTTEWVHPGTDAAQ